MLRRFRQVAGVVSVSLLTAACAFETTRDIVAPTESGGDLSSAAGVVWTSNSFAPDPSSCGNFEWKITSQTPTSMAGDFRASCMNGAVEISGSASGSINGSIVPMSASGQATGTGLTCPFALTGTGHILDENSMRVDYQGTTCAGLVSGSEILQEERARAAATAAPTPAAIRLRPTPRTRITCWMARRPRRALSRW